MNERLQKSLDTIEGLIKIQRDSLERGYMHGLLNGLIMSHSIITEEEPLFYEVPRRRPRHTNIRHKARLEKRKK